MQAYRGWRAVRRRHIRTNSQRRYGTGSICETRSVASLVDLDLPAGVELTLLARLVLDHRADS